MKALLLAVAVFGVCLAGKAQDIIVTAPVWQGTAPAPDVLPQPRRRLEPEYPAEMRSVDRIGYAFLFRNIDPKGEVSGTVHASEGAFKRAIEADDGIWHWRPAQRSGRPERGHFWVAIIFNPAQSAPGRPDAGPRLLAAGPVWISGHLRAKAQGHPPIKTTIDLDREGRVQNIALGSRGDDGFAPAIRQALNDWHFAPARENGQPIPSQVMLPILVFPDSAEQLSHGPYRPPEIIKRVQPVYPPKMIPSHMEGEVDIAFDVDVDGKVQNATIVRSNNPGFEEPALVAVRKWRFRPALVDGRPTAGRTMVTITFGTEHDGQGAYALEDNASAQVAEAYRYDTPPRIRGTLVPIYPYNLLLESKTGTASVSLMIDTDGQVVQTKVLRASSPEFGLALTAAIEAYDFDPAYKKGRPISAVIRQDWDFDLENMSVEDPNTHVAEDYRFLSRLQAHPERVVGASALDQPLRPISRRQPVFPPDLSPKTTEGKAIVRFYIDEHGLVRGPRYTSASDPLFGFAAVQAIAYWQFDPPRSHGKPVVTVVQVPIHFVLQASPP